MKDLSVLNEKPWVNIDPDDETTWPDDEQLVWYYFIATAPDDEGFNPRRIFGGNFYRPDVDDDNSWGGYSSWAGFCDWYDAPYWMPREEDDETWREWVLKYIDNGEDYV